VNERQLGRVHRALRKRLGVTQREISKRSGVPRNKISELERFNLTRVTVSEVDRCFEAMDASLRFFAEWNGAALDRLLDEGHAALVGAIGDLLRGFGWLVEYEVTFSRFGDRGSIDVLAWHAASRTLLVIEVKTELASLEGLLRPFDVKFRLASVIAAERFGWHALHVARLLVLPEHRTVRRAVTRHSVVLESVLPARNREIRQWLASPDGPVSGLMFLTSSQLVGAKRNPSAIKRVRNAPASMTPPDTLPPADPVRRVSRVSSRSA
jgi:transcriptional regulator with XRE-family HTH domain